MADSEASIRVVCLRSGLLTARALHELSAELTLASDPPSAILIDCSALERASPDGLAALLALGRRGAGKLALAGLSRSLLRTAVQARLARYFSIYSSQAAFVAAHAVREGAP